MTRKMLDEKYNSKPRKRNRLKASNASLVGSVRSSMTSLSSNRNSKSPRRPLTDEERNEQIDKAVQIKQ